MNIPRSNSKNFALFLVVLFIASVTSNDFTEEPYEATEDTDTFFGEDTGNRHTAIVSLYASISAIGLIANGIVFFVIFCGGEIKKTVTSIYVVQLAIADSAFLFVLPFFTAQLKYQSWDYGQVWCTACYAFKILNYYAGIFFLTAMSVDRYIAVAYSTRTQQLRTRKRTWIVCAIVWLLALTVSLPAMNYASTHQLQDNVSICLIRYPGYKEFNLTKITIYPDEYYDGMEYEYVQYENDTSYETQFNESEYPIRPKLCFDENEPVLYTVMQIVRFVLGFMVPLVVISMCYFLIIKKLRESEGRLNRSGRRTLVMSKKVTRMVFALIICFVICWLPYHIFFLAKLRGIPLSVSACSSVEQFVVVFASSNSVFNPILYTFLGHNFRGRLIESVNKTRRRMSRGSRGIFSGNIWSRKDSTKHFSTKHVTTQLNHERRGSPVSTGCDVDCPTVVTENVRRSKCGIPLLDLNSKKESVSSKWRYEADQEQNERSECVSRS